MNLTHIIIQKCVFVSFRIRKVPFPVKVCRSAVQLHMRGKPKSVTVETKPGQTNADFKKSRDGFVLLVPSNWVSPSQLKPPTDGPHRPGPGYQLELWERVSSMVSCILINEVHVNNRQGCKSAFTWKDFFYYFFLLYFHQGFKVLTGSRVAGRICFLNPELQEDSVHRTKELNSIGGKFGGFHVSVKTQDSAVIHTVYVLYCLCCIF